MRCFFIVMCCLGLQAQEDGSTVRLDVSGMVRKASSYQWNSTRPIGDMRIEAPSLPIQTVVVQQQPIWFNMDLASGFNLEEGASGFAGGTVTRRGTVAGAPLDSLISMILPDVTTYSAYASLSKELAGGVRWEATLRMNSAPHLDDALIMPRFSISVPFNEKLALHGGAGRYEAGLLELSTAAMQALIGGEQDSGSLLRPIDDKLGYLDQFNLGLSYQLKKNWRIDLDYFRAVDERESGAADFQGKDRWVLQFSWRF